MSVLRIALMLAAAGLAAAALARAAGKSPAEARALFDTKCAPCHGKAGQPNTAFARMGVRAFGDAEWQKSRTDAQIRASIAGGKPGTSMRAFKDELKPEEIDALVRHVRTLAAPGR
jgi:mono/diheme cytochrome c family protein